MVDVQTEILICRPHGEVAAYAANPDNAPQWYEKLVMRTAQGPFPMETTYTWAEVSGGTRMTLGNSGKPSGFSWLAGLFMAPMIRRATRKDLQKLKSILEAGEGTASDRV